MNKSIERDFTEEKRSAEHDAYSQAGGFLTKTDYDKTMEYMLQIKNDDEMLNTVLSTTDRATKLQFTTECGKIEAEGSLVQQALYCYLRRYEKDGTGLFIGKAVRQGDQEVCATIFLQTGDVDSSVKYMAFYPNIFKQPEGSEDEIKKGLRRVVSSYDSLRRGNL